jgi:hypothetical protein
MGGVRILAPTVGDKYMKLEEIKKVFEIRKIDHKKGK